MAISLTIILASSCRKNEPMYSCDPSIDSFVAENLDDIQLMTRADIVELEPEMTRACFWAFSKEQKLNFWQNKFQEVLTLDRNENGASHFKSLLTFINENPDVFDKDFRSNDELNDKLDIFAYKRKEYAEETLGWSKELIVAIIMSPYKVLDKEGNTKTDLISHSPYIKRLVECSCNTRYDECGRLRCTESGGLVNGGCGPLMGTLCDGRC